MIKSTTTIDYQRRMNRVTQYPFNHLGDDVRIDDLVEVANLSLHSSVESFGRSFKEVYLKTPGSYRQKGSHSEYKSGNITQDHSRFFVSIEPLDVSICAAVARTGSYMQIDQAMGQLIGNLATRNLLSATTRMMAVFYDDPAITPADQLRSAALSSIEVNTNLPAAVECLTLHQGPCAQLLYTGPYADMKDAYQWLYGVWLPRSYYEAEDAPNVEEYLNNPMDVAPTELQPRMCLPLKTEVKY